MNFRDVIYEILITENEDKKKVIQRAMGFSEAWAEEFYRINPKACIWVANSFLNDFIVTHKKDIEKLAKKRFTNEKDIKKFAREYLNQESPKNIIWRQNYEPNYRYIMDWLTNPRIASRVNVKILSFKDALEKSTMWHESLESGVSSNYTEEHEIIIDYRVNGVGFYWANLDTSFSEEEKRRMGHCGNDSGKVIFSLRSIDELKDGRSHVTISFDPKTNKLGQMKGPKNRKPKTIFHKYIIDIVLNDKYPIVGFDKNIYSYDNNFQLNDLTEDQLNYIFSKNREVKIDYIFGDKKKLYPEKNNNNVYLFRETIGEHYCGIVNIDTLEVIKDFEYEVDDVSDFTDMLHYNKNDRPYTVFLKEFRSVKEKSKSFILSIFVENGQYQNFSFIDKDEAQDMIDNHDESIAQIKKRVEKEKEG